MKTITLFTYIIISFYGFLQGQERYTYEKNLKVIRDPVLYIQLVKQNPDNKLVNIEEYVPGIIPDIRYATINNFTGLKIYNKPMAYTRLPVANALKKVQLALKKNGLGLIIYDAYRPYSATVKFYEVYHDTTYVASPYTGSRHNRGAAVDVSIVDLKTGKELEMPTPFDDFTEKAHPGYQNLSKAALQNRKLLMDVMQKNGFTVYPSEWWHYDYKGWERFDIMDLPFEEIEK